MPISLGVPEPLTFVTPFVADWGSSVIWRYVSCSIFRRMSAVRETPTRVSRWQVSLCVASPCIALHCMDRHCIRSSSSLPKTETRANQSIRVQHGGVRSLDDCLIFQSFSVAIRQPTFSFFDYTVYYKHHARPMMLLPQRLKPNWATPHISPARFY